MALHVGQVPLLVTNTYKQRVVWEMPLQSLQPVSHWGYYACTNCKSSPMQ